MPAVTKDQKKQDALHGCVRCNALKREHVVRDQVTHLFDNLVQPIVELILWENNRAYEILFESLRRRFVLIRNRYRGNMRPQFLSNKDAYRNVVFVHPNMDRYVQGFCYIFGDDPDVVRIITSFSSSKHWDKNTKSFESPLIIESGGLFGFNKRPHRVENPLERSIFAVLERLQKLEFYDSLVQQLRMYMINIRYFIGIAERVAELNVSQKELESFISDVRRDFECLIKRFVYFYLMNLDDDTIKSWFTFIRRAYDQYEREVLTMVQSLRDSTSDCCGKIARNCSMTCSCPQPDEHERPQKKRKN